MVGGEPKRKREEEEEEKREEQTTKEKEPQERRMKVPVKSMVMREPKEVKIEKTVVEEKIEVEEEQLVESFKKMKVDNTRYMTLVKHEGDRVEVEAIQDRGKKLEKPSKTPPKLPQPPLKVLKVKGIDNMTVEELKAALKKRKMMGLTGLKKEQLIEKLKKEIKSQRTMGGSMFKTKTEVRKAGREEVEEKEKKEGEEVHDKFVHHGGKEGEGREDEGTRRNRVED